MKRNPNIFDEHPADEEPSKKRTPSTIYANVKSASFSLLLTRSVTLTWSIFFPTPPSDASSSRTRTWIIFARWSWPQGRWVEAANAYTGLRRRSKTSRRSSPIACGPDWPPMTRRIRPAACSTTRESQKRPISAANSVANPVSSTQPPRRWEIQDHPSRRGRAQHDA